MPGYPWIKARTDLPRDPRSLYLAELLGDARAWTYLLQLRFYLAEHAPAGRICGQGAVALVERAAGWEGPRGRLVDALRDAGFVRAGPARDGEGTEIEDLDWAKEQGAHIAKFDRDAKKSRGVSHNVVSPSRDIGGTLAGPAASLSTLSSQISDLQLGGLGGPKPADSPSRDGPPDSARQTVEPLGAQEARNVIALPVSARDRGGGGHPPAESLPDGVDRVNRAVRGAGYPWNARTDEPASRNLLAMAGAGGIPEVLRRFENGLRAQFKQRVDSLRELIPKWNANAQSEQQGAQGKKAGAGPPPPSDWSKHETQPPPGPGEFGDTQLWPTR